MTAPTKTLPPCVPGSRCPSTDSPLGDRLTLAATDSAPGIGTRALEGGPPGVRGARIVQTDASVEQTRARCKRGRRGWGIQSRGTRTCSRGLEAAGRGGRSSPLRGWQWHGSPSSTRAPCGTTCRCWMSRGRFPRIRCPFGARCSRRTGIRITWVRYALAVHEGGPWRGCGGRTSTMRPLGAQCTGIRLTFISSAWPVLADQALALPAAATAPRGGPRRHPRRRAGGEAPRRSRRGRPRRPRDRRG